MPRNSQNGAFNTLNTREEERAGLTKDGFEKVVGKVAPGWPLQFSIKLFEMMDKDNNGILSFEELMVGLSNPNPNPNPNPN